MILFQASTQVPGPRARSPMSDMEASMSELTRDTCAPSMATSLQLSKLHSLNVTLQLAPRQTTRPPAWLGGYGRVISARSRDTEMRYYTHRRVGSESCLHLCAIGVHFAAGSHYDMLLSWICGQVRREGGTASERLHRCSEVRIRSKILATTATWWMYHLMSHGKRPQLPDLKQGLVQPPTCTCTATRTVRL